MNQLILDSFKNYVSSNYSNHNIKTTSICSNLHCSVGYLHNTLTYEYGYSIMRYVEYVRILKSIEYICKGARKVYHTVGYKSSSVFSKSFLRVTGFNARDFFPINIVEHENIMRTALEVATENPKKAIEIILNDVTERSKLSEK